MAILLRLLFAHILSDFVFQNDKIYAKANKKRPQRSMFINYYIVSSML